MYGAFISASQKMKSAPTSVQTPEIRLYPLEMGEQQVGTVHLPHLAIDWSQK